MFRALFASTLLALSTTPVSAASAAPDGAELLRACSAAVRMSDSEKLGAEDSLRATWCVGYVSGFLDGVGLLGWKGGETKVCLPAEGISNDQGVRILVKYLRANPEELHKSGRMSLLLAIGNAFACR